MKKIVVALLLFSYSLSTVGATVHFHYCMNQLVGWDYTKQKDKKCGKCGMTETKTKNGCCKDETKRVKLETDHQKSTVSYDFDFLIVSTILPQFITFNTSLLHSKKVKNTIARPPHIYSKQDINILYGVFRI